MSAVTQWFCWVRGVSQESLLFRTVIQRCRAVRSRFCCAVGRFAVLRAPPDTSALHLVPARARPQRCRCCSRGSGPGSKPQLQGSDRRAAPCRSGQPCLGRGEGLQGDRQGPERCHRTRACWRRKSSVFHHHGVRGRGQDGASPSSGSSGVCHAQRLRPASVPWHGRRWGGDALRADPRGDLAVWCRLGVWWHSGPMGYGFGSREASLQVPAPCGTSAAPPCLSPVCLPAAGGQREGQAPAGRSGAALCWGQGQQGVCGGDRPSG